MAACISWSFLTAILAGMCGVLLSDKSAVVLDSDVRRSAPSLMGAGPRHDRDHPH